MVQGFADLGCGVGARATCMKRVPAVERTWHVSDSPDSGLDFRGKVLQPSELLSDRSEAVWGYRGTSLIRNTPGTLQKGLYLGS
jgi:hypothetical protein